MSEMMTEFLAAWPRHSPAVELGGTPAYPLARTVAMPPEVGYPTGALSFRMAELALSGLGRPDPARCTLEREGRRVRVRLVLDGVDLSGRYTLEARPDPIVPLDTGGDLMVLPPEALVPGAAGSDAGLPALDPEKETWLEQARAEREKLSQTDNGQKLLGTYSEHNETYAELFEQSDAMRTTWQAGGVTRSMAGDTHGAVTADDQVNDRRYTRQDTQETVSYNSNAFTQQLAVAMNTMLLDADFDPFDPDARPAPRYLEASRAALSFGKAVKAGTGNDKASVNPLTPTEIYGTVATHQGDAPPVTDEEAARLAALGGSEGGEGEVDLGWTVLDEEDQAMLRTLFQSFVKERAERAAYAGRPVFRGACTARMDGVEAVVEMEVEADGRARPVSARVALPAFELDIDDAAWTGDTGRVARQRLGRMFFIGSLLRDLVAGRLEGALRDSVAGAYQAALAGA